MIVLVIFAIISIAVAVCIFWRLDNHANKPKKIDKAVRQSNHYHIIFLEGQQVGTRFNDTIGKEILLHKN